jgi:hypothetical protein
MSLNIIRFDRALLTMGEIDVGYPSRQLFLDGIRHHYPVLVVQVSQIRFL